MAKLDTTIKIEIDRAVIEELGRLRERVMWLEAAIRAHGLELPDTLAEVVLIEGGVAELADAPRVGGEGELAPSVAGSNPAPAQSKWTGDRCVDRVLSTLRTGEQKTFGCSCVVCQEVLPAVGGGE